MTTQQLIPLFLKHLSERNLNELVALFSDDVDWYIPGDESKATWLGKRTTRQEVSEFYDLLWKQTEPVSATIDHIFIDANQAVIAGEFSTKMLQTNKVVESLFYIHLTIEHNVITRYRLLEDSLAVAQALTV